MVALKSQQPKYRTAAGFWSSHSPRWYLHRSNRILGGQVQVGEVVVVGAVQVQEVLVVEVVVVAPDHKTGDEAGES